MDQLSEIVGVDQATILAYLQTSGLAFARILTAISLVPFFGGKIIKGRIKMSLALAVFLLLAPAVMPDDGLLVPPATGVFGFAFLLGKEVLIGFVIGFLAAMVFHVVEASGRFLDLARGASMAQVLSPQVGTQVSLFGQLWLQMTIVLFFIMDGHHYFLQAFARSFELLPVAGMPTLKPGLSPLAEQMIRVTGDLLLMALQLSAPAVAATYITDVFLGIANKVAPNVQVFFLGMPVKAMLGILMMFIVLALFKTEVARAISGSLHEIDRAIRLLM